MRSFLSPSTRMLLLFTLLLLAPSLAYGQKAQKKSSSSGLITAEDIAKYPNDPLERIITRLVSGVEIVRTESGSNILRIRGAVTLPDGKSGAQYIKTPLYVVDGMPTRTEEGALPAVDPQDLDSIRVVKGAATAAWGIDGGDGVILFFTKRGTPRSK